MRGELGNDCIGSGDHCPINDNARRNPPWLWNVSSGKQHDAASELIWPRCDECDESCVRDHRCSRQRSWRRSW